MKYKPPKDLKPITNNQQPIVNSGFTLIELLVVIGVITILMGVSLFGLSGSRETARDTRRKADLETIRSALELYRSDCRYYPLTLVAGSTLTGDGSTPGCSLANVYLQTIPTDPIDGRNYLYTRTSLYNYTICSALESDDPGVSCIGSCGSGVTCNYQITNP